MSGYGQCKRRGMSTALAVVVGIIVLLVVAMAVIGVTNLSIGGLSEKSKKVNEEVSSGKIVCSMYVTKEVCESHSSDGCTWKEIKKGEKVVGGMCVGS